ncbi:MAG: hypothetical protein ACRCUY_00045, partial [Thermoguttaceae bacterium]
IGEQAGPTEHVLEERVEDIAGLVVLLFILLGGVLFGFGCRADSFHGRILPEITRDCKTAI